MRVQALRMVQGHYTRFEPFLVDGMKFLGFGTSRVQKLIGNFMEVGPQDIMVQAQRGQAKTTIAALFCTFTLVHNPCARVLIVSSTQDFATGISGLIAQLLTRWEVLQCLAPDRSAGDKASAGATDVFHVFKGVDKSHSVNSLSIQGTLTGNRADLLLLDDIETPTNTLTAGMRETLLTRTRQFPHLVVEKARTNEFTSEYARHCRTVWLGTPQHGDSLYNTLPGRGVSIRIWPGRFPTAQQEIEYGGQLAPEIAEACKLSPALRTGGGLLGDLGQPTDPELRSESILRRMEQDSRAEFMLQYMLNTRLVDAGRHPLTTDQIVYLDTDVAGHLPVTVVRGLSTDKRVTVSSGGHSFQLTKPHEISTAVVPITRMVAYVDPAAGGENGDETGFAVGCCVNSTVYVVSVGGVRGGYEAGQLDELARILCATYKLDAVVVEKNLGFGLFTAVFAPIMREVHIELHGCAVPVSDTMVTGQKERRIVRTLAPVLGRGSLVMTRNALEMDNRTTTRYDGAKQKLYSILWQLSKITEKAGCLTHDDRADALASLVNHFGEALRVDQDKQASKMAAEAANARIQQDLRLLGVANVPEQRRFSSVMREL